MNNTYTLEFTESEIKTLEIALALASRDIDTDLSIIQNKIRKVSEFIKRIKLGKE